ncbi:MAG: tetratricopeptide repeat protein, partial [Pyrinomonadaceae bacterium]|nr:tetratricopeptide repeat protein [Pyrinomonadaceae bacterium]
MSRKQGSLIISIIFLLCSAGAAYPQHQAPEDQIKLGQKFFEAEEKCRGLLRNKQWKEAEVTCKAAVQLADRFADYRELEKMGAYENVGNSLAGQRRYEEAINYFSRAIEVGKPRVDDTNAEVGCLYGSIAIAYHALRNLDKAREFYRKAVKTYQAAYSIIDPEAEHGVEMRQGYLKMLKSILEYHLLAAEQAGALAEV